MMCSAEELYSEGHARLDLDRLELAARLFPFNPRYRRGPAELAMRWPSDALTVDLFRQAVVYDPNELWLWEFLVVHSIRRGDMKTAEWAIANAYRVAPHSQFWKAVLVRRPDP